MKNKNVKSYYEKEARDYTEEFYTKKSAYPTLLYRQNYILAMIQEIGLAFDSKILDVGCGPGELLAALNGKYKSLTGIDIASEMIAIANNKPENKQAGSEMTFETGDIEHLRFADHSFDLVICSGVVEYLKDDEGWMKEINRVLKPGGYLIINVTNKFALRRWTSGLVEKLKSSKRVLSLMNSFKEKVLKKGKVHYFPFVPRLHSPSGFDTFLSAKGFKKINHNYFDFAVLPAPFDTLFSFVLNPVKIFLERFSRRNMVINGTGYIVKAQKTGV